MCQCDFIQDFWGQLERVSVSASLFCFIFSCLVIDRRTNIWMSWLCKIRHNIPHNHLHIGDTMEAPGVKNQSRSLQWLVPGACLVGESVGGTGKSWCTSQLCSSVGLPRVRALCPRALSLPSRSYDIHQLTMGCPHLLEALSSEMKTSQL